MKALFWDKTNPANDYYVRAEEFRKQYQFEEAEAVLRAGVAALPDSAWLWNELGRRIRRDEDHGRDEEALDCFEKAHKLAPQDIKFQIDYAGFLGKQGYFEQAEIMFLDAYKDDRPADRKNCFVLAGLGNLYLNNEMYEYAIACYGQCLEIAPQDDVAQRKCRELGRQGLRYSHDGWDAYMQHAQVVVNKAHEGGTAPGMEFVKT